MLGGTPFCRLLLALVGLSLAIRPHRGIVVDGDKKKDVSATANQSDEKSSIDPYNTKACGVADPNYKEHEFVNMAREGQFPWIVSFQIKVPQNATRGEQEKASKQRDTSALGPLEDLHFCSGSFISDKWILTAAHCFAPDTIKNYLKNDKLKVVAGSHKVSSRLPINRNLTISRIFIHSKFNNSQPIGFDVALVELKSRVEFSQRRKSSELGEQSEPFMNTVCLPVKGRVYKFNETARIAGWGLSNDKDTSSMPSKLLTTDILLSELDVCVQNYTKSMRSDEAKMQREKYNDFLCASFKNTRDACQSDSGGPLMQYADRKAVVIGIVSYGIGCATKGVPGLYTRTSAYINWIKDITLHGRSAEASFRLLESDGRSASGGDNSAGTSTTTRPNTSESPTTSTSRPRTTTTKSGKFKFFDE